ncbi:MAG TPA: NAD(P)H-dependent oxidoreductase [Verrucomicrobiota bacterium]|nr:NAD(P)H-dependent oxidoreductase [Verrucomicrobiota bacterium]HNU49301.1 NAD(P)H-dependent oxidoreductase [Verrucomicrobiota bacterium]
MTILIILGHPSPGSFNHAIARTASEALAANGHRVILRDLYAEGFDPVLPASELAKDAVLPAGVARHVEEVCAADGLVIVHPNWWSQPPAIVRGWTDRVLRAGRAYRFVPDGQGGARSEGLLRARVGIVFNTANTPQEKEVELYGDPLELLWRRVVFGLCGVPTVCRRNFSPVIVSTPAQREAWLHEVRDLVSAQFPRS